MCGIVGALSSVDNRVPGLTYRALEALVNRGQESAGLAIARHGSIHTRRGMGLVDQALGGITTDLPGMIAIGHTRYSTQGESSIANAQPLAERKIAIVHNGNLTNTSELRQRLNERGVKPKSSSDTAVILALIHSSNAPSIEEAVIETLEQLQGAFSLVVMTPDQLIIARDPHGYRPLVLGRKDNTFIAASETFALETVGATYLREVRPGEVIVITSGNVTNYHLTRSEVIRQCPFELIYLAHPKSQVFGEQVHDIRIRHGRRLAEEAPVSADIVVPVLGSGEWAAKGFAEVSGLPIVDGLRRSQAELRTFMDPDPEKREKAVRRKLTAVPELVAGKRVVFVDDSIVRGNTTRVICQLLREAGATEVHARIASPPIKSPCHFGIDMKSKGELIAAQMSTEEIREQIGADSLAYLSLASLLDVTALPRTYCTACFTGQTCRTTAPGLHLPQARELTAA